MISLLEKRFLGALGISAILIPLFLCSMALCSNSGRIEDVALPFVTPEMRSYSHIRYALYFIGTLYDVSIFCVAIKLSARMRDFAESKTKRAVLQFLIYYLQYFFLLWLLDIPWKLGADFWLEHHFHLSHQGFASWVFDQLKATSIELAMSMPVAGLFFWLVRRFPKRWPYFLFVTGVIVAAFTTFISPIVLEPVFNKFTSLPPGPLRQEISALAAAAGEPQAPIYVADKSEQTDKFNAYVSGFGSSMRVVIWDTTLNKMPEDQLLAIVAHELGHYFLKHIYWGFVIGVAIGLVQIPVNICWARPFVARLPKSWKLRGLEDFAIMPALGLLSVVCFFIFAPFINLFSRYQEHQADAFSLAVTKNGPALARSFVTLSKQNLSDPNPPAFIKFWLFSHPTLKERIEFALGKSNHF